MKLVKSATFEVNETQQVILQSMSLAASKLWNVGNYEKHTYKEQGLDSFPNWYDQKKRLKLPYFKGLTNIKEVTLYPEKDNKWKAIAVYEVPDVEPLPDNGKYLSMDLGIKNFATCYSSSNGESFILAKQFLELNHYYNKRIAHYQGISDAQQAAAGVKYPKKSKRVLGLYEKYRNSVNDLLHKASTYVRDYCVSSNINTVIVGDITGIRDGNDLGHRNNQAFHALPYKKFTGMLSYKLALVGISLVFQKESFSSQCSPLAPSVSKKYAVPKQRVYRGLYNDRGHIFNADAAGAYNILRLAHKGESFPLPYRTAKVSV